MTTPTFTIVFPSRCSVCAHNNVPAEERTVIVLEHEERCGKCGNSLGSRHTINSTLRDVDSQMVRSILRSLVQHGVFEIDVSPGSQNPLRLCRQDDQVNGIVTCHINYSTYCRHSEERVSNNRYERSKIGCTLPACVRSACELLSNLRLPNLDGSNAFVSFDGADVKRERKSLKFTWVRRVDYDNGYKYCYECISLEIAWTAKDDGTSLIPSPEEAAANQKHQEGAAAELRIAADVAALRLACAEEINSTSKCKSVPVGGTNHMANPPKEYNYHPAAIEQIVSELDARGWRTEIVGPGLVTGVFFLNIERK